MIVATSQSSGAEATFSNCGRYRYLLTRRVDPHFGRENCGTLLFVMLNPSTATATEDDPTIRRCVGFARREGYGRLAVANPFAWRATSPDDLKRATDPVGPKNEAHLRAAMRTATTVVFAWGNHGSHRLGHHLAFVNARELGVRPLCLGITKRGHPNHPLYLAAKTPLVPFPLPMETP